MGTATITEGQQILCIYYNQGSITGALYDFDEPLELISCDILDLGTGESVEV